MKTVKDLNAKVKTILMSAFDVNGQLFQGYTEREIINGFVKKPIRLETLVQHASEQLHHYEMQKIFA